MKKLIIASVILIVCTLQTFAGPIVSIQLELGRRSTGCTKFGICKWSVQYESNLAKPNGSVQIVENTNILQITLDNNAINGKEEYFKGSMITFEEEVLVPADILKALKHQSRIVIQPGTYKVIKTRNGYQINIPLN